MVRAFGDQSWCAWGQDPSADGFHRIIQAFVGRLDGGDRAHGDGDAEQVGNGRRDEGDGHALAAGEVAHRLSSVEADGESLSGRAREG